MKDGELGEGRRRSARRRWIVLAVVAALVIASGVYLVWPQISVKKRLAALRAAGYPTSFAELAEYTKLPEGAKNAAGTYEEAFYSFVTPNDVNVPLFGSAELPGKEERLRPTIAEAISKCLTDNQECLALLREAGAIGHCRYEYDYARMWPYVRQAKQCARLLRLATLFHAHSGDSGAAAAFIDDGLWLTNSLAREPGLIGWTVRSGCIQTSVLTIEQALNVTHLSDEQLRQLDEGFRRAKETLDVNKVLATERCYIIEGFRNPSILSPEDARFIKTPLVGTMNLVDYLDYMADCMEAFKLPGRQRPARLGEIRKKFEKGSLLHAASKRLAPGALDHFARVDQRVKSLMDLARTAIAIERYRLAKGELPERLRELVPEYLEEVPIDPFDGKTIKYRRMEPGYVLYSVGMDGKDDGGKERTTKKRGEPYDSTFVVTR